ncbi:MULTISPECIES: hypothetical protein [unclassified Pseudomonas]|uniref:hypothetical protein n=1 Tax=unclassified Pseudomonas TaxID=196821 RepID=UPI0035BFD137
MKFRNPGHRGFFQVMAAFCPGFNGLPLKELLALAQLIEKKAETIKQPLDAVTSAYDDIIADMLQANQD